MVSPAELVAETVKGEEQLKILWNDHAIQNAASVQVAFWNNGSQFIDTSDIPPDDPIKIVADASVKILAVSPLSSSRNSLFFDSHTATDANGADSAVIGIRGNEALEHFDGAVFQILYSGPLDTHWRVTGRVKGAAQGFRLRDWNRAHNPRQSATAKWWSIAGLLFVILAYGALVVREIQMARKRNRRIRALPVCIGLVYTLVVAATLGMNYLYVLAPSWLNR